MGRQALIVETKDALANFDLATEAVHASGRVFGAARGQAEITIRQVLLTRVGGLNLNKALLAALGGGVTVVHPLPAPWRDVLRRHGFVVAEWRSGAWWQAYVVAHWLRGAGLLIRQVLAALSAGDAGTKERLGRYAYFDGLGRGNLPAPGATRESHDILSWYCRWSGRLRDLDALTHSVTAANVGQPGGLQVIYMPHPFPPLASDHALRGFVAWGLAAGVTSLIALLRGRWADALLFSEGVKAAQVRFTESQKLARDYLFHNSNWIYRPIWTHEAEAKGSRILFYYYSTNCESFKEPAGYPIQANCWQVMNWPCYLVWDEPQADFVRRAVGARGGIEVVGPIGFIGGAKAPPAVPARAIAVFDVQPVRETFYATLGLAMDYYVPDTAIRFLADVHEVAGMTDAVVALKRKREIGRLAHPHYRRFIAQFAARDGQLAIDPEVSAHDLIAQSAAVISMPFTSTALIARNLGKPSCYYDPSGLVQKNDRAAHGIEIVSGRAELACWLAGALRDECPKSICREPAGQG